MINNEFEAEKRIVIETVALRLGVSPTPVREALARLAGEQLVSFRAYVGYAVLPPLSISELNDLFEAREIIETAAAVRACERSSEADLASLLEINERIRTGNYGKDHYSDFVSFVNNNQRFHETLLDGARNPALRRAFDCAQLRGAHGSSDAGPRHPGPRPDLRRARGDHRGPRGARRRAPRCRRDRPCPRQPRRLVEDMAHLEEPDPRSNGA